MPKLDRAWAKTQVEAFVDGHLAPNAEQRMRALLNCDAELAAEVERARALRDRLRGLQRVPVPAGLGRRLWQIPAADRRRHFAWFPASAVAAAASVVVAVGIFFNLQGPSDEDLAREAAIQDFRIAMAYLQKSALVARNEVNAAVGSGVMDALVVSRGAIGQTDFRSDEGE